MPGREDGGRSMKLGRDFSSQQSNSETQCGWLLQRVSVSHGPLSKRDFDPTTTIQSYSTNSFLKNFRKFEHAIRRLK